MLRHDLLEGLVVIGAGGLVLRAAVVADGGGGSIPALLIQIEPGDGLERQIIHTGEQRIPLTQEAAQVGDLVFLDAVLFGGVVDADEHMEIPIAIARHCLHHLPGQLQLAAAGAEVLLHFPLLQAELAQRQLASVASQAVIRLNGLHRQGFPLQHRPARHTVSAQGIVAVQIPVVVAHRGSQAHHAVQQPYLVVSVPGQGLQQ